jgi:hypothetical protein
MKLNEIRKIANKIAVMDPKLKKILNQLESAEKAMRAVSFDDLKQLKDNKAIHQVVEFIYRMMSQVDKIIHS